MLIEHSAQAQLINRRAQHRHIDIDTCTEHGVVVSAAGKATAHPTARTWGLILGALRQIPYEVAAERGTLAIDSRDLREGKTLVSTLWRIGSPVANGTPSAPV